MVNVNGVKRSKTEENLAQPSSATGLSMATKKNSHSRPRKKFDMVPCNIPRCKNCGTIFHDGNSMATECRFHRVPPQSYEVKYAKEKMILKLVVLCLITSTPGNYSFLMFSFFKLKIQ